MDIKKIVVGPLETNCYILCKDSECLIIDPGDEFNKIRGNISGKVIGVLVTHYHFDHVGALKDIKNFYKASIYDANNLIEGKNQIGNFIFNVINTPGHTKDSISFLFDNNLFCGDFIFSGTIGRTDLGGNTNEMISSIKKIIKYPDNLIIYPGHGGYTNLKVERNNLNFILQELL